MLSVQRGVEAIAAHQVVEAIAWLDECQMHAAIIELLVSSKALSTSAAVTSMSATTWHCRTIQAGAVRVPFSGSGKDYTGGEVVFYVFDSSKDAQLLYSVDWVARVQVS